MRMVSFVLKERKGPETKFGKCYLCSFLQDSLNLIKNGMFFDLGLRTTDYHKTEVIRDAILDIDDKFTLVLIYEYLDESLVLMKRKLCWELDDVLYLKFHYQLHGEKTVHNINSNITGQIYRWNKADAMLYQYFNKTLWNEIRLEGKGFVEELREFRTKHDEIERDCLGQQVNLKKIALNANVTSFNRYFCQKMLFREIEYVHYFRRKMENSKRKTPTNGFAGSGNGTRIFSEHAHERNGEKTSLLVNETDASSVSSR